MSWKIGEHKYPQVATFWKIYKNHEDRNWAEVSLTTSDHNKQTDTWENSGWGFCRFVGSAYRPELFELEPKDRIEIISGIIDRNSWVDKETNKRKYPQSEKITIFAWRKYVRDNDEAPSENDSQQESVVEEDDKLPF